MNASVAAFTAQKIEYRRSYSSHAGSHIQEASSSGSDATHSSQRLSRRTRGRMKQYTAMGKKAAKKSRERRITSRMLHCAVYYLHAFVVGGRDEQPSVTREGDVPYAAHMTLENARPSPC